MPPDVMSSGFWTRTLDEHLDEPWMGAWTNLGGHPTNVLRSAAVRKFIIIRCFYLRPKNSNPRMLLGDRADRTTVLAITKKFVCLALIINKWEAIEVRAAGG